MSAKRDHENGGPAAEAAGKSRRDKSAVPTLFEVSWETCQKIGGIYTVIRTKVPTMVEQWGKRYCLLGPYNPTLSPMEFEEARPTGVLAKVVKDMEALGIRVYHGSWLVTGHPMVILFDQASVTERLPEIKAQLTKDFAIPMTGDIELLNAVTGFGWCVEQFFRLLCKHTENKTPFIALFHEWMAGSCIPGIRKLALPVGTIFHTHATQLGRYMAMNLPSFYDKISAADWRAEAKRFGVESPASIERVAANNADVFTTLSKITAMECEHLLGRSPDLLLPNGLSLERFVAMHEFQNLHRIHKDKIMEFVMAHFFPSQTFDIDNTLLLFTSGRYEYRNKGFDVTLEAMARLNERMRATNSKKTVIFFLITRRKYISVISEVFRRRAVLEEMHDVCEGIKDEFGHRLFLATAMHQAPNFEKLVSDNSRMRLRQMAHTWKSNTLPPIVTHELVDQADEVLVHMRKLKLFNNPDDPVKLVYYPEFVAPNDALLGMEYDQFVRGCHLGVFPSYYEPWGYTPMECIASGVPAVTSDLSGFGSYLKKKIPDYEDRGLYVLHRRNRTFDEAADDLTDWLYLFTLLERRDRIQQRNKVEQCSEYFDWRNQIESYNEAIELVQQRRQF